MSQISCMPAWVSRTYVYVKGLPSKHEFSSVRRILWVSCTLLSLCWKSFDPPYEHIFERASTFIRERWFRQSSYKLKSSQETGTWVTKSIPDPAETLSCEINTFWWQSWDYTSNALITMSTMAFTSAIAYCKINSSRLLLHFVLLCNFMAGPRRKTSQMTDVRFHESWLKENDSQHF